MKDLQLLYIINDESNVLPVIEYEEGDELIHTDEDPNCPDFTCPCNTGNASEDENEEVVSC